MYMYRLAAELYVRCTDNDMVRGWEAVCGGTQAWMYSWMEMM